MRWNTIVCCLLFVSFYIGTLRVYSQASESRELLQLIDLNTSARSAGLNYLDNEPSREGHIVLFDGRERDVIYYITEQERELVYAGAEGYLLRFQRTVGEEMFFTEFTPAGDRHTAYALDLNTHVLRELPSNFDGICEYARGSDMQHLLPDGTLIVWDSAGIHAARPPYQEAERVFSGSIANRSIRRNVIRPDGQMLLFGERFIYRTDGTPEGTERVLQIRDDTDWDKATVLEVNDTTYLFRADGGYLRVPASGAALNKRYMEGSELIAARYSEGVVYCFLKTEEWQVHGFRLINEEEVDLTLSNLPNNAWAYLYADDFVVGKDAVYFEGVWDRKYAILIANLDYSEPRRLYDTGVSHFDDQRSSLQGAPFSNTDQYLELKTRTGYNRYKTSFYRVNELGKGDSLQLLFQGEDRADLRPVDDVRVAGEPYFYSGDRYAGARTYLLHLRGDELVDLGRVTGSENLPTILPLGGKLFVFDDEGGSAQVISRPGADLEPRVSIGSSRTAEGAPRFLLYPDRLRYFNKDYSSYAENLVTFYFSDYRTETHRNYFNLNHGSRFGGFETYSADALIATPAHNDRNVLVLTERGRSSRSMNYRDHFQYSVHLATTDSLVLFRKGYLTGDYTIYDRDLNQIGVLWLNNRRTEGWWADFNVTLFRNQFYYIGSKKTAEGRYMYGLFRIDQNDHRKSTLLYAEDFGINHPRNDIRLYATGQNLYVKWPSSSDPRGGSTLRVSDGAELRPVDNLPAEIAEEIQGIRLGTTTHGLYLTRPKPSAGQPPAGARQLIWIDDQDAELPAQMYDDILTGEEVVVEGSYRSKGEIVLRVQDYDMNRTALVRLQPDGRYVTERIDSLHQLVSVHVEVDGTLLYLSVSETGLGKVFHVFRSAIEEGMDPTLLGTFNQAYTSGIFGIDGIYLIGQRYYYLNEEQSAIAYFDLADGTTGQVATDADISSEAGAYSKLVEMNGLLYGMVKSFSRGKEPFYLDPEVGRLISGTVFHDVNRNDIQDEGEPGIGHHNLDLQSNDLALRFTTDEAGSYSYLMSDNTQGTLTPAGTHCDTGIFNPRKYDLPDGEDDHRADFALVVEGEGEAGQLEIVLGNERCNTSAPLWVQLTNTGCRTLTGELVIDLPPNVDYLTSDSLPLGTEGGRITYAFSDLGPLQQYRVRLEVDLPDETYTGTAMRISGLVKSESADSLVVDSIAPVVRCAYDPNDKLVEPRHVDPDTNYYAALDDELVYTIRFQNTGNDTAYTVRLEDRLSEHLDWSTYRLTGSGHPCTSVLTDEGLLTFQFEHIMLPDSSVNLLESQGFVRFTIRPLQRTPDGTRIENSAAIFFDFNSPIITNTVYNTIVPFLDEDQDGYPFWEDCNDRDARIYPGAIEVGGNGIDENCDGMDGPAESIEETYLTTFPNPVSSLLTVITSSGNTVYARLYDVYGKAIQSVRFEQQTELDIRQLPRGGYLLRTEDLVTGQTAQRWIIKR